MSYICFQCGEYNSKFEICPCELKPDSDQTPSAFLNSEEKSNQENKTENDVDS
jgi:hypothetical protein